MTLEIAQFRTAILRGALSMTPNKMVHVRTPATVGAAPGRGQKPVRHLTMEHVTERWLPVVGYEGYYEVSSLGRVRSLDRWTPLGSSSMRYVPGRVLVLNRGTTYLTITLCRLGYQRSATVHPLVCRAFHGEKPQDDFEVRHLNGDPLDNRAENLAWGSRSENAQDTLRHGNNVRANKTRCKYGHDFTPENTYITTVGGRDCRTCHRIYQREVYRKKAERLRAADKAAGRSA